MAVRRELSNDHVAPVHETFGCLGVYHRGALCRADAGHGGRVYALAVGSAENVLSAGAKPVPPDNVYLRRRRAHMLLFHLKSGKSFIFLAFFLFFSQD